MRDRTPIQTAARLVGVLGIFQVSVLHNLVHAAFGLAGLALAATPDRARTYLVGGGAIYLVLWIYGLIIDRDGDANFIPLNEADNWVTSAARPLQRRSGACFASGSGQVTVRWGRRPRRGPS
jgi:hypothetical protein